MRVRMKRLAAGPNGTMHVNQEYEVSAQFGEALVNAEAAVVIGGSVKREQATKTTPEHTTGAGQKK